MATRERRTELGRHDPLLEDDLVLLIPAPVHPFAWMRPAEPEPDVSGPGALRALSGAIEDLPLAADLAQILPFVTGQFCELLGVRRCGLFLRETEDGLFRGHAGQSGGRPLDIGGVLAGIPADALTREILAAKRPVEVRDATSDTRPVRSAMRRWNVRSLLGVPLLLDQQVEGIAFLDDLDRRHAFSAAEQDLAFAYAKLAASLIASARVTTELRATAVSTERRNSVLWQAVAADDRLTALALDGANVHEITQAVAELTGRPCSLYDAEFARRARAQPAAPPIRWRSSTTAIATRPRWPMRWARCRRSAPASSARSRRSTSAGATSWRRCARARTRAASSCSRSSARASARWTCSSPARPPPPSRWR